MKQFMLSIKDRAREYAYNRFGSSNETQNEWEDCQEHFIAGANEMLPIIKELGKALKDIQEANSAGMMNINWLKNYLEQILEKYKQYL